MGGSEAAARGGNGLECAGQKSLTASSQGFITQRSEMNWPILMCFLPGTAWKANSQTEVKVSSVFTLGCIPWDEVANEDCATQITLRATFYIFMMSGGQKQLHRGREGWSLLQHGCQRM